MPAGRFSPVRILLADANEFERVGIRTVLRRVHAFSIVAEPTTAGTVRAESAALGPDVILLRGPIPGEPLSGLCQHLLADRPGLKILAMLSTSDSSTSLGLIKLGVQGILLDRATIDSFVHAVKLVAGGGVFFDPWLASQTMAELQAWTKNQARSPLERLSGQELRLLPLLADGLTNRKMAAALALSELTVKSYLHKLYRKLGVTRRSTAVRIFAQTRRLDRSIREESGQEAEHDSGVVWLPIRDR